MHANTKTITYREIYNYLFEISNPENSNQIERIKDGLKQLKVTKKNLDPLTGDSSIDVLKQIVQASEENVNQLKTQIDDLVKGTDFIDNREKIIGYRNYYSDEINKIGNLKFDLKILEENLKKENQQDQSVISNDLVKQFVAETNELLPKSFQTDVRELLEFNQALVINKANFLDATVKDIKQTIEKLQRSLDDFLSKNSNLIGLIKSNDIDKYDALVEEYTESQKNLERNRSRLDDLEKIKNKETELNEKLLKYTKLEKEENKNFENNISIFNAYFQKLMERLTSSRQILAYEPDPEKFPLTIPTIVEGTSTGTKKTMVLAYDIAYQKFSKKIDKKVPNFVVHDILENIEGRVLHEIINEIESSDFQFIFAILKEKLNSSNISEEEQNKIEVLTLAQDDRLFMPKQV